MKNASAQTQQLIENNAKLAEAAAQQAAAAVKQAEAIDKDAVALRQNAEVAHENTILAQRAWVGPRNASIVDAIEVGKPINVLVEYANTGREPAIDFIHSFDGFAGTPEEENSGKTARRIFEYLSGCQTKTPQLVGQVVFPSTGFSQYNLNFAVPGTVVDQDVIDGKKALIFQGCFLYKSFDVVRHSYFCYFYNAAQTTKPSKLNICLIGHYAD